MLLCALLSLNKLQIQLIHTLPDNTGGIQALTFGCPSPCNSNGLLESFRRGSVADLRVISACDVLVSSFGGVGILPIDTSEVPKKKKYVTLSLKFRRLTLTPVTKRLTSRDGHVFASWFRCFGTETVRFIDAQCPRCRATISTERHRRFAQATNRYGVSDDFARILQLSLTLSFIQHREALSPRAKLFDCWRRRSTGVRWFGLV